VSGLNGASSIPGDSGLALDTGVAVEFRIAKHLSIGPHAEFVYIDTPSGGQHEGAPSWLAFGGHVDFIF
jgi:hypothetical protein